jgi:tellurite resistance protein TerC
MIWAWTVLGVVVLASVAIDLFGHRGSHGLGRKAAITWSIVWVSIAIAFGGWIAYAFGREAAEDYYTAFLVEKSLSVDNLFVFLVVFRRLDIPERHQHRVLVWGILGAFVTRAAFVASGTALLSAWHGIVYPLGAFLVFTGIKTARESGEKTTEPKALGFLRRRLRVTPRMHGTRFLVIENGRRYATPLLLALVVIEITDVLFAVDSLPAVFAITEEPFIVYASNVFAILGLRALYLVLADMLADLEYLKYGLAAILVFTGLKMLGSSFVHVPHVVSLGTIATIIVAAVVPSLIARKRKRHAAGGA